MNKLQRINRKIVSSIVALILAAAAFIASICYAWFIAGQNSQTENTTTKVIGGNIYFAETITAIKYCYEFDEKSTETKLTTSDYTYTIKDNQIVGEKEIDSSDKAPLFMGLLPGDYVDITFKFYAGDSSLVGKAYELSLADFAMDEEATTPPADDKSDKQTNTYYNSARKYSFRLAKNGEYENTVYGALGVFKWGLVTTTTDASGNKVSTCDNLKYFHSDYVEKTANNATNVFEYYKDGNDDSNYSIVISTGTLNSQDEPNEVTLRIQVNFDDFYEYRKNYDSYDTICDQEYLYNKTLSIGQIILRQKDTN